MPNRAQMLVAAAITYRQLDHWTTRGYLRTYSQSKPGTGSTREWLTGEDQVAANMARLVTIGLEVLVAAHVARLLAAQGHRGSVCLADGITIEVLPTGSSSPRGGTVAAVGVHGSPPAAGHLPPALAGGETPR
jgi:hypothetical protein